jgi:hypothetical protein
MFDRKTNFLQILVMWSRMDVMYFTRHVSTNSRPVRTFFSNFAYIYYILVAVRSKLGKRGPSDQNMPRRNDKLWKSTVATSDLSFLCFRGFTDGIQFFCFSKVLFLHLPLHAARLLGLRFRAPNGITGRAPTTPGEVPTGVGRTATWHMWHVSIAHWSTPFEAYSACHVAQIDTWYHLIGPHGIDVCHVSSAHWSVPFLMPVGVYTWQPCGRLWSDGPR